tara:strand:- start:386 stop:796 length:411 start_codon:yes stop_codon:yes gene_type:complete
MGEMQRPLESHGLITNRGQKEGAQFVHAFFDRFENICPRHVPRRPSHLVALITFNVMLILGIEAVAMERRMHHDSLDPVLRLRWIVMLLAFLGVSVYVATFVGTLVYKADSIKLNEQHFANVFWIGEYLKAFRWGT